MPDDLMSLPLIIFAAAMPRYASRAMRAMFFLDAARRRADDVSI